MISRQFTLNLRKRTEKPTEFLGDAFNEEEELSKMNESARKQSLRDSSAARLQLAFVFWNEETMADMLRILSDYPMQDVFVARLHSRLCFVGLASFALAQREDCKSFTDLGKACLRHFEHLTKQGSVNAKPVYLFLLAVKNQSRESFTNAIAAASEACMIHLEAMAKERYAVFLTRENDEDAAREYLVSSYWAYQDWGAHAKALALSEQHHYLKHATRKGASSLSRSVTASERSAKAKGDLTAMYTFNTTFRRSSRILVKKS